MNMVSRTAALAMFMSLALTGSFSAQAVNVVKNLDLPATLDMSIDGGCSNRGPDIVLGPTITLHNVPVTVYFDGGGSHDQSVREQVDLTLELSGEIVLPKQGAAVNGVTGNPKISVVVNGETWFGPVRCNKLE
ncbi:hypothetical protein [Zobellella maritima]|uniref:hypothetical protein n=1 Tax=Zobellella maritima TaxID=2059725 RepID=UPI000E305A06|nr:hypothetical protein [Zobellella maritima]